MIISRPMQLAKYSIIIMYRCTMMKYVSAEHEMCSLSIQFEPHRRTRVFMVVPIKPMYSASDAAMIAKHLNTTSFSFLFTRMVRFKRLKMKASKRKMAMIIWCVLKSLLLLRYVACVVE
jgi:hypothetical protein